MPDRLPAQFTQILICAALLFSFATQAQSDRWYQVELMVFSYRAGGAAEQWEATPHLAYPRASRFLTTPSEESTAVPQGGQAAPFIILPSTQQELRSRAAAMERSGRYRILFHEAWTQPMTTQAQALPIVLDHSGDGGQWPALQGSIKLYLARDLYLETNLWLNTQGEYLNSSWSMPPPPRGPASRAIGGAVQRQPEASAADQSIERQSQPGLSVAQAPAPGLEEQGPIYPFRHAVLLKQTQRMRSSQVYYLDHPMLGVLVKVTPLSEAVPETVAPTEPGQ